MVKKKFLLSSALLAVLVASCNSGGSNNDNGGDDNGGGGSYPLTQCGGGSGGNEWNPNPYSCPPEGKYNGTLFSNIAQPSTKSNGILTRQYPESYLPTFLTSKSTQANQLNANKGLQIAYGRNDEASVAKIAALVTINNEICSATPVKYDESSNTTYLISAAHCFANGKESANIMSATDLVNSGNINIYYGVSRFLSVKYPVKAIYVPQNYCFGESFSSGSSCANFNPYEQAVSNGQGNDIAIIQIDGEFGGSGNRANYPHVVPATEYPTTNSLAPILSIGYGVSTQKPLSPESCTTANCAIMYYVAGYQYATASTSGNESGYHYLFNSFYSKQNPFKQSGYTALICGGDSGGGDLFWTGEKWILLSEHTYGPSDGCGLFYSYLPSGATNVSAYYEWIMRIFNNPNPVAACKSGEISNCTTNGY